MDREAKRRQRELENRRQNMDKMQELERAAYEVEVYENYIEVPMSMHKECGETWEWNAIKSSYPPSEPKKEHTHEQSDKMLRGADTRCQELKNAIDKGGKDDEQIYNTAVKEYEVKHTEWEELVALADRILSGDLEAYY